MAIPCGRMVPFQVLAEDERTTLVVMGAAGYTLSQLRMLQRLATRDDTDFSLYQNIYGTIRFEEGDDLDHDKAVDTFEEPKLHSPTNLARNVFYI